MANSRSLQAWENFRQRVAELGGVVLEPQWLGALKGHLCRCTNGHECRPRPNGIQQGEGLCRTCGNQNNQAVARKKAAGRERFYRRVAELGGTVLEPRWLGSGKPHRCLCARGHECSPTPSNTVNHGICQTCAGNDPAVAWENFRQCVAELGGEVLEPKSIGKDKPHRCLCAEGHECSPSPSSIQRGQGMCLTCAGRNPAVAWENFRQQVAELDGTVLEQEWLGARTPHLCRCVNGHECKAYPNNVQQGEGLCRVCADRDNPVNAQRKHVAGKNFYRRVAELGGTVLETGYLGGDQPHRCRCARGHECSPRPASIRAGQGICQVCSWLGQDVLYVLHDPVTRYVKFGITSRDGRTRLGNHRSDGFTEVILLETGLPEGLAAHVEQKIKLALAMAGANPVRGREYFSDEHVALVLNEIGNWIR